MLEALLLAAAQATSPVATPTVVPARATLPAGAAKPAPPSAELLEFLADWSEEEGGLIDEVATPARPPAAKP